MTVRQRRRPRLSSALWVMCGIGCLVLLAAPSNYVQRIGAVTAIIAALLAALHASLASQAETRSVMTETLAANAKLNEYLNDCAITTAVQRRLAALQHDQSPAGTPIWERPRNGAALPAGPGRHRIDVPNVVHFPTQQRRADEAS